jgi:hypothetical protein
MFCIHLDKKEWATFWAIFLQNYLVTLSGIDVNNFWTWFAVKWLILNPSTYFKTKTFSNRQIFHSKFVLYLVNLASLT